MSGWLKSNAVVINALATIVLAIIGVMGLIFIVSELTELRKQNSFIETNLKQTYRPLGIVVSDPNDPKNIIIGYIETQYKDKFSFIITYSIRNYGQGVLSYIGYFASLTKEPIDFRSKILDGYFDTLIVDAQYSYTRKLTIIPYDKMKESTFDIIVISENKPFEKKYYLYTLFLYEDQYGNLYDTEHLEVLPFKDPIIKDDKLITELDQDIGGFSKETYYYYNNNEKKKLIACIRDLDKPKNHPIANIIEGQK